MIRLLPYSYFLVTGQLSCSLGSVNGTNEIFILSGVLNTSAPTDGLSVAV